MDKALLRLKKDPVMASLVKQHKLSKWRYKENLYEDLLGAIVGQQLSVKAADTIWKRVKALLKDDLSPENILKASDDKLREAGMSWAKIKYMNGIAQAFKDGEIVESEVVKMSDEEVIETLTKLNGIGRWSAEMILIFTLGRLDVFSIGDMGLRNAVSKLYGIDKNDLKRIEELSLSWKPYRSIASRFLWKSLDNAPAKDKLLKAKS